MGLDNGIMIRITDSQKFGKIPKWIRRSEWEELTNSIETNYWRKCWNVRAEIFDYINRNNCPAIDEYQEYEFELSINDTLSILKQIKENCYSAKKWDSSQSIWTWNEIKRNYKYRLRQAKKIVKWLKRKPIDSYQIIFYDSY